MPGSAHSGAAAHRALAVWRPARCAAGLPRAAGALCCAVLCRCVGSQNGQLPAAERGLLWCCMHALGCYRWPCCQPCASTSMPCCRRRPGSCCFVARMSAVAVLASQADPLLLSLQFMRRQHLADVTEIFRQASRRGHASCSSGMRGVAGSWLCTAVALQSGADAAQDGGKANCGMASAHACLVKTLTTDPAAPVLRRWAPASSARWPSSCSTCSPSSLPSTSECY